MRVYFNQKNECRSLLAQVIVCAACFISVFCLIPKAQARFCLPEEYIQRNATQSYLIRLTEVGYVPMGAKEYNGSRTDTRGARFEVLKIYSGNVESLKNLQSAMLVIQCSDDWKDASCAILEQDNYPFYEGQMMILYAKPNHNEQVLITVDFCSDGKRWIADEQDIEEFERRFPPIWVSQKWEKEHTLTAEVKNAKDEADAKESLQNE